MRWGHREADKTAAAVKVLYAYESILLHATMRRLRMRVIVFEVGKSADFCASARALALLSFVAYLVVLACRVPRASPDASRTEFRLQPSSCTCKKHY